MNNNQSTAESVRQIAAQRAARKAAAAHVEGKRPDESNSGAFAVYAWAAVGLFGFAIATHSLISPIGGSTEIHLADNRTALSHTNDSTESGIDQMITSSIAVEAVPAVIQNILPRSYKPKAEQSTFGAQIGKNTDLDGLVASYTMIESNTPDLLNGLIPLIDFEQTNMANNAKLIAGPFQTRRASVDFCANLSAQTKLTCTAGEYKGDPLLGN